MAYDYITETGVIVPDTADVIAEVENEWKAALGRQDLATTPDTPQGVLITQEVIARQGVILNNAELANQINPNLATGVFLDAICAFTGLERKKATKTLARAVLLTGAAGTNIQPGARAATKAGDIFRLLSYVTLDETGEAAADFEAEQTGAVPCDAGALESIIDPALGWETVANPTAGVIGQAEESDEALFLRRKLTLARQGISTVEAQISGLYDIPGVRSLQFRENVTAENQVIDGIPMLPHSIWACVDGGTDIEVAASLMTNKTDGADWNGAVEVAVREEWSGQTYLVRFDRPVERPVLARVTIRDISGVDPQYAVREAIVRYARGEIPGERGLIVGANVSPFEFSWAINHDAPEIHVSKVEVSFDGENWQTEELAIALNEKATITAASILVIAQ
jgi:hypothetical protein